MLDYADYEHLTLDLLLTETNERTPLCATVSARYAAVLVDEYQDTNALQDAIYFALARPEPTICSLSATSSRASTRFRLADPGIFVDKQQRWQPHPAARAAAVHAGAGRELPQCARRHCGHQLSV